MPGTVVQLRVEPGAAVSAGETLVVLESMKMEISIAESPRRLDRRRPRRRRRPGRARRDLIELAEEGVCETRRADDWCSGGARVSRVLTTAVDPRGPDYERNEAEHRRLVGELRGAARPRRRGRRREGPRPPRRARQAAAARAGRPPARPRQPLPRARPARRRGPLRRRRAGRRDHRRGRPGRGPRGRRRRQRRDRQRRHLLPDDGEEAPAGAGGGAAEPAALPLPGRLGRRLPADAGRGLPRPRALRPHLLQPGDDVGAGDPAAGRGDGLVHGGRRLRPGDERRDDHRPRPGHDLPRRPAAGEGGDRPGGDRRGARRRRRCTPAPRGSSTTSPPTTPTRCGSCARSSPPCRPPAAPGSAPRSSRPPSTRPPSTAPSPPTAAPPTTRAR